MIAITITALIAVIAAMAIFVIGQDTLRSTRPTFILCGIYPETEEVHVVYGSGAMFLRLNSTQIAEYELEHIHKCTTYWQAIDQEEEEEEEEEEFDQDVEDLDQNTEEFDQEEYELLEEDQEADEFAETETQEASS